MERLLNPSQLAEILGVRVGTVYYWISTGADIPPFVKIRSVTRWREKAVMDWITAREKDRRRRNFED
jgi:predicted DNA-binding transcriptional regulator AlpA